MRVWVPPAFAEFCKTCTLARAGVDQHTVPKGNNFPSPPRACGCGTQVLCQNSDNLLMVHYTARVRVRVWQGQIVCPCHPIYRAREGERHFWQNSAKCSSKNQPSPEGYFLFHRILWNRLSNRNDQPSPEGGAGPPPSRGLSQLTAPAPRGGGGGRRPGGVGGLHSKVLYRRPRWPGRGGRSLSQNSAEPVKDDRESCLSDF